MKVTNWLIAIQTRAKISETQASRDTISQTIRGYMPVLDGYRGIAILLVFLCHVFLIERPEEGLTSLLYVILGKICRFGWCGVDAFFVLSGFLITGILLDTREQPHYFRNFYARRILRIFPIYYVTLLIVCVLLAPVLNGYEFFERLESDQAWYWFYLENWTCVLDPKSDSPILHFWSLATEEQFYLVWPLLVYLVPRRFLGWLIGISILYPAIVRNAILLTHPPSELLFRIFYHNTLSRVDALAFGAAIALLLRSDRWRIWLVRLCPLVALLSSSIIGIIWIIQRGFSPLSPLQPVVPSIGYSLLAICFGSILVSSLAAAEDNPLVQLLNWSPLKGLGRISYGFYVYHWPILYLLCDRFPDEINSSYLLGKLLLTLCCGGLTLMAALLSWHCLEQPILKLKRYFPTRKKEEVLSPN